MQWFSDTWNWLDKNTGWATEITGAVIILLITALLHYLWLHVHARVSRGLEKTEMVWDDSLWRALKRPLTFAVWLIGLAFSAQYALEDRLPVVMKAVHNLRTVGLVILLSWFLIRFLKEGEKQLIERAKARTEEDRLDQTTVEALAKLGRIAIVLVMSLIMLDTMGFSISGLLAFGGIGGLAISFAAKDLLANFFGGLMLYWDRPFVVGDSIRSPDREIEGSVEYIGWRHTRIRTVEKRALYVPNSIFPTIALENVTRMDNRRIRELVGLRYQDSEKLPAVLTDIQSMLKVHPELVKDDVLIAHFTQFADSSLTIMINAHTVTTDWAEFLRVKESVLTNTLDIIRRHGAEVAFPTRTVLLEKNG